MAPSIEISIPTTSISSDPKPYTLYNITIRLPLRSFTVQRRYSEFQALHQSLTSQAAGSVPPPASLPGKSWFFARKTTSNPQLTEERRKGLETYLRTINETDDARWRNTTAWKTFLNLPSSSSSNASAGVGGGGGLHASLTSPAGAGAPITDAVVWLDCHRNLKSQLHDARIHLQSRDQALTTHDQHESSAAAKRCLLMAGGMITALDQGLKYLSGGGGGAAAAAANGSSANNNNNNNPWRAGNKLGEGELRRRRDLIAAARKEKDGLEALANSFAAKITPVGASNGGMAATAQQKSALFGAPNGSQQSLVVGGGVAGGGGAGATGGGGGGGGGRSRRVLGVPLQETEHTRELDNDGVLQLQKQVIEAQDKDVQELTKGVLRMKELGLAINEELAVQNDLMTLLDEDVTRVAGKVQVAKKRVGKIS